MTSARSIWKATAGLQSFWYARLNGAILHAIEDTYMEHLLERNAKCGIIANMGGLLYLQSLRMVVTKFCCPELT